MFSAKQIIDKKREGLALSTTEIREFMSYYMTGEVPDYQMSALAMAICCRGMTERETADLTEAMRCSGEAVWEFDPKRGDEPLPGLPCPAALVADKHSTGGVGDKLSLIIQPLAAACGLYVPSLTGRGLGLTGGTADKLETIPGYVAGVSLDRFRAIVAETGVSMAMQTPEICPADKRLYALRDVTGTVASIPLITASILSKKFAEGAPTLVFDVKCGLGAFMHTRDEARALASSLVGSTKASGRKSLALVTDMDAPLGRTVGNANEVEEALDILENKASGPSLPAAALCIEFAAAMVSLAKDIGRGEAREMCKARLADGSALAKFKAMVAAHGGDLDEFRRTRREAKMHRFRISAMRSGYVTGIDAKKVAQISLRLGAGRQVQTDTIDPHAGVDFAVARGDRVAVGAPLATLFTSTVPDALEECAAELLSAFTIAPAAFTPPPLVIEEVG